MSHRYSIAAARAKLPAIVDQAEAGLAVELTRRGKAVAVVVSLREFERGRAVRASFRAAYGGFLKNHVLADVGLEDDFAASVRDTHYGRTVAW